MSVRDQVGRAVKNVIGAEQHRRLVTRLDSLEVAVEENRRLAVPLEERVGELERALAPLVRARRGEDVAPGA